MIRIFDKRSDKMTNSTNKLEPIKKSSGNSRAEKYYQ
jgi:hypothetical protein